jgi:hypothetical protein
MLLKSMIIFNGVKYVRLPSGYYISSSKRNLERRAANGLHVAIWEFYSSKKVPKGWQVHHKDGNIENNEYSNLECLSAKEHASRHRSKPFSLEKARIAARKWHSSEEGLEWHREHAKRSWETKKLKEQSCLNCGDIYEYFFKKSKYCSSFCRNKHYYETGKTSEMRICIICGNQFRTLKVRKASTCSHSCRNRLRIKDAKGAR